MQKSGRAASMGHSNCDPFPQQPPPRNSLEATSESASEQHAASVTATRDAGSSTATNRAHGEAPEGNVQTYTEDPSFLCLRLTRGWFSCTASSPNCLAGHPRSSPGQQSPAFSICVN